MLKQQWTSLCKCEFDCCFACNSCIPNRGLPMLAEPFTALLTNASVQNCKNRRDDETSTWPRVFQLHFEWIHFMTICVKPLTRPTKVPNLRHKLFCPSTLDVTFKTKYLVFFSARPLFVLVLSYNFPWGHKICNRVHGIFEIWYYQLNVYKYNVYTYDWWSNYCNALLDFKR